MGWSIQCSDSKCSGFTWANNIVDLIQNHTDKDGWFKCSECGKSGYIEKHFNLQEPGKTWDPYLRGIIPLGDEGDTYQPFVFIVSYEPKGKPKNVWFSYFKDLRRSGGRLKLGYGPGGPPVLNSESIVYLLQKLIELKFISVKQINEVLNF